MTDELNVPGPPSFFPLLPDLTVKLDRIVELDAGGDWCLVCRLMTSERLLFSINKIAIHLIRHISHLIPDLHIMKTVGTDMCMKSGGRMCERRRHVVDIAGPLSKP